MKPKPLPAKRVERHTKIADWKYEQLAREVQRIDPALQRGSDEFNAGMVLIAGLIVGPSQKLIAARLGCEQRDIRRFVLNLRLGGIFTREGVCLDGEDGIAFCLGVAVALGWLQRTRARPTPARSARRSRK